MRDVIHAFNEVGLRALDPSGSPTCTWTTTRRGGHIYTISPDGTGNIQVTSGPATDEVPDWRPA